MDVQPVPGRAVLLGLATTGEESQRGIDGALYQRGEMTETTLTMGVDSIEDSTKKVLDAGGELVTGKGPVPGMGYFAQFKDTEGNVIGIFENDPSAQM